MRQLLRIYLLTVLQSELLQVLAGCNRGVSLLATVIDLSYVNILLLGAVLGIFDDHMPCLARRLIVLELALRRRLQLLSYVGCVKDLPRGSEQLLR